MMKKTCIDCKQEKPLGEFYRHPNKTDGRQSRCKVCDNKNRMGRTLKEALAAPAPAADEVASYGQIARVLGVSVVRVQQIEKAALMKLYKRAVRLGMGAAQ